VDEVLAALGRIPATAWTAFGTALIAFSGVWLTNWNNRQSLRIQLEHNEKLQLQRVAKERLEELYILASQWNHSVFHNCLLLTQAKQGGITYKQYLEHILESDMPKPDYSRLRMIVHMYADKIEDAFHGAVDANAKVDLAQYACRAVLKRGPISLELLDQMAVAQSHFIKAWEIFRQEIVKAAKQT